MSTTELVRPAASNGVASLPSSATVASWTPQQKALMMFAGIAKEVMQNGAKTVIVPNPGVAEAFLMVCKRTGLDPFAKQIYAMEVKGNLSIVVGVDGFRIVAQRSHGYRGQIGPQWFTGRYTEQPYLVNGAPVIADGKLVMAPAEEWVNAWTPEALGMEKGARPVAARVGILREGFPDPLWQVVTWDEFGVEPRYPSDNWGVRPAHMLGIRAETHGLRRTFPNDLSGLYTAEDFDGVDAADDDEVKPRLEQIKSITDLAELQRLYQELHAVGMPDAVRAALMVRAGELGAKPKGAESHDTVTVNEAPAGEAPADAPAPEEAPRAARPAKKAPTAAEEPTLDVPANLATGEMSAEEYEAWSQAQYDAEHAE